MMNTIQQQFLNPFSPDSHKEKLYNIVSGYPVNDSSESLVMLGSNAEMLRKTLKKDWKLILRKT